MRTGRQPYSQYIGGKCSECGAPLRPRKSSLAKYPDTVEHRGKGLCGRCYTKTLYVEGIEEEEIKHFIGLGYTAAQIKQDKALREMCVDYTLRKLGYTFE